MGTGPSEVTCAGIERALRDGVQLRAFLSGGGLRVLRLEKDDNLVGYGEHFSVEEACVHVVEDYLAGGRPYSEVYGKIYDHYLTGSSSPSSKLDAWLLKGSKFLAYMEGDEAVFVLKGYEDTPTPEGYQERALAEEILTWEHRGYTYQIEYGGLFANGEPHTTISIIASPGGNRSGSDPRGLSL